MDFKLSKFLMSIGLVFGIFINIIGLFLIN